MKEFVSAHIDMINKLCHVVCVCFLQGASCPEPSTVYVDMQALRNDRVTLVEKGSPNSLCLMESGKVCTLC